MLHIVNKSPFDRHSMATCLDHATSGSAILLIEDGIYGAMNGTAFSDKIKDAMKDKTIYVLGPDAAARGMQEDKMIDGVNVVDYNGFVDLVADNEKLQSWL